LKIYSCHGEIKIPEGYRIYKSGDFIRKTAEGQLDLQRSLDLVKELVTASGFHQRKAKKREKGTDLFFLSFNFCYTLKFMNHS
jgi:hypothetical protein